MTKRPHYELILAWANGADIQCYVHGAWRDVVVPVWQADDEYRIKPREFEEGHWYPVLMVAKQNRTETVMAYTNGVFRYDLEGRVGWKPDEFTWIGESLGALEFPDE